MVKKALNNIIKNDETSNQFMLEEKKLTGLLSIVKSQPEIQEYSVDVLFMQHLSKAIRNAKSVKSSKGNQKEQIKELISRSIESDDIVDVFAMAGLERADLEGKQGYRNL